MRLQYKELREWWEGGERRGVKPAGIRWRYCDTAALRAKMSWMRPLLYAGAYVLIGN